jgi:type II secretory pathway pseudopilin PulG
MGARLRSQSGFIITIKLQTIVIVGVVALLGLIVIPVWVSRSAGPREATLAMNVNAVAKVYSIAVLDAQSSLLMRPGPQAAAELLRSVRPPVTNQRSHSSVVQAGDEWRTADGAAPGVWITANPVAAPEELAKRADLWTQLAGTVIVHVNADGAVDIFAVAHDGSRLDSLEHLEVG